MKSAFGENDNNLSNQDDNPLEFGNCSGENLKGTGEFQQIEESFRKSETPNELSKSDRNERDDRQICTPGKATQVWDLEDVFQQKPIKALNPFA